MCNKSETIGKIAAALVAFSGEVETIGKDTVNPFFNKSYTTLDHMIEVTKPILHKHGLTIMQFPAGDGEKITVRTMILHTSGEWIESEPLTLKAVKMDPQGAGSAITYARRYSYAAALSLSLGDDDDGNSSSTPQKPSQGASSPAQSNTQQGTQNAGQASSNSVKMISDAQIGLIKKLVKSKNISDDHYRTMIAPKSSTKELTSFEGSKMIEQLTKMEAEPMQDDVFPMR